MTDTTEAPSCSRCGDELDEEEKACPSLDADGDAVCDRCYEEYCCAECSRCSETTDKSDLKTDPGLFIIMMEETDEDLPVGYYRILRRPFFVDAMLSGWFIQGALQRVADLDETGNRAARERISAAGPVCTRCQKEVQSLVDESSAAQAQGGA